MRVCVSCVLLVNSLLYFSGKSYAFMSMKTTLAHVFRHYRLKGDHSKMEVKIDVMLKPVSGYYISIERRNKDKDV